MENNLKKILIVSSYAPPSIGGPQMLYNLFKDFPADRYSVLTSYYNIDDLSATKGTWLSGEYIFYDNPKCKKKPREQVSENKKLTESLGPSIAQKLKLKMKRFWPIRILAGFPVIIFQILTIVRSGKLAIQTAKSDVILGISDYGPAMIGSFLLHKITKKPLYLFMFDLYRGNFFPFPGGLLATIFEKSILKGAEKIIVNNEGTKDFYEKRYGKEINEKITIIHNSIFPESYSEAATKEKIKKENEPYLILFTGRIGWPQLRSIKNLIQAVNEMKDINIRLNIYTPMPKKHLDNIGIKETDKVKISFAPPQDMPKIQNDADILFIPLSWKTKSQAIIDTATPGKLTDYLIAGRPILVHSPASSFLVKYAKENNFAAIVEEESMEKLKEAIKKIILDKEFREKLVENSKKTFFKNHNANKNYMLFKSLYVK